MSTSHEETANRVARGFERDAEFILEKIMNRTRWTAPVRDELAAALVTVSKGKRLNQDGRANNAKNFLKGKKQ